MNLNELTNHPAWNDSNKLATLLLEWSNLYYNEGNSPVDDAVYDAARKRLEVLDANHPCMAMIGAPASGKVEKHKIAMGSLNNVNNEEEFLDWWHKTVNGQKIIVQHKYDGLSLGLDYRDGSLIRGLSRGDGIEGENLTDNIRKCWNSSQINTLKKQFGGSVRCEGIVYREDFTEQNFPGESNPRNSAVGAIRKSNSPRAKWVRTVCYDLAGMEFTTEEEKLLYMKELGLPVCDYWVCDNPDEVITLYRETEQNRHNLPYAIDGIVLKINDVATQKALGSTHDRPKWARAFKFACLTGKSVVRNIILSVGHTGAVIPTAEYDPVMIEGKCFQHALLDNFDTIEKWNLNINDEIEIEIAGDVIPKLKRLVTKNSNGCFPRPTACPVCGASTEIEGAYTRCSGQNCPAKSIGKINNWIKKTGIKYFGESRQQTCYQAGLITKISDLYDVTVAELGELIGDGNAAMVKGEVDKCRTLPLHVFVGSLGVRFLGRSNAKKLIQAGINSLERFMTFDPEIEKGKIGGFGDNLKEIALGIKNCEKTINDLLQAGVAVAEPTQKAENQNQDEGNKSFCFTGVRLGSLKEAFDNKGWIEKSGVSGNLDYLVAKDPSSNSGKMKKAREAGIKIISMAEFQQMLGE